MKTPKVLTVTHKIEYDEILIILGASLINMESRLTGTVKDSIKEIFIDGIGIPVYITRKQEFGTDMTSVYIRIYDKIEEEKK